MSKPIKMTEQILAECRADFEKALALTKLADGKLNFTKVFSSGNEKATVFFTPEAFAKMTMLLQEFSSEVAWHGVASRLGDEAKNEYLISDIVVYPQTVTGATVDMDTDKYAEWLMQNAEDERFDHLFMQGHSHVNMGTSPSSVDLQHQEEILGMLGEDDFYIFMIWNKSFQSTNKIYDLKKNTLFENGDISVKVQGGEDLGGFLKNAKEIVKSQPRTYGGGSGYTYIGGGYTYNGAAYNYSRGTTGAGTTSYQSIKDEAKKPAAITPYDPFNLAPPAAKPAAHEPKDAASKKRSKPEDGWQGTASYQQSTMYDAPVYQS